MDCRLWSLTAEAVGSVSSCFSSPPALCLSLSESATVRLLPFRLLRPVSLSTCTFCNLSSLLPCFPTSLTHYLDYIQLLLTLALSRYQEAFFVSATVSLRLLHLYLLAFDHPSTQQSKSISISLFLRRLPSPTETLNPSDSVFIYLFVIFQTCLHRSGLFATASTAITSLATSTSLPTARTNTGYPRISIAKTW